MKTSSSNGLPVRPCSSNSVRGFRFSSKNGNLEHTYGLLADTLSRLQSKREVYQY